MIDRLCRLMGHKLGTNNSSAGASPFDRHRQDAIRALSDGVAAVYGYDIEGDIAEFGTMTGQTAAGLARAISECDIHLGYALDRYGTAPRRLHLFDSFAGLPVADHIVDSSAPHVRDGVWSAGSCTGVSPSELRKMVTASLPDDRVSIFEGWFKDTVPALSHGTCYGLVHVDSDLYASAADVLNGLFSRAMIAEGAMVYFDDWNCNRASNSFGERRAWRECVDRFGVSFSDEGSYGIFAHRFTIHTYHGMERKS